MKKTQSKDNLRNIRKQWVSFLSIAVIAMLGVAVYLGIGYSAAALRRNGSDAFNRANFRDIEVISTLLLTQEDAETIAGVPGVADLEQVWQTGAKVRRGDEMSNVNVISATERINQPRLLDGRLPQTAAECAVERQLARQMGWQVGDSITVESSSGGTPQYLLGSRYQITGILEHPDHSFLSFPEKQYVVVTPDAFDADGLDGCFMKAEVVMDKQADVNRFGDDYHNAAAAVQQRIGDLADTRIQIRADSVRAQIDENQAKLDEGRAKLEEARAQLDDGWAQYEAGAEKLKNGEAQLAASRLQLNSAKAQLDSGKRELADAEAQLSAAEAQLSAAEYQLDSGKAQLVSGWDQLESGKTTARDAIRSAIENRVGDISDYVNWAEPQAAPVGDSSADAYLFPITDTITLDTRIVLDENIKERLQSVAFPAAFLQAYADQVWAQEGAASGLPDPATGYDLDKTKDLLTDDIVTAVAPLKGNMGTLADACTKWNDGNAEYIAGEAQYQAGWNTYVRGSAQYQSGLAEYEAGLAKYKDGLAKYNAGLAAYEAGKTELASSLEKLENGEAEYAAGLAQYEDGVSQLEAAKATVSNLAANGRWLVLDGRGNAGFMQLIIGSQNLSGLKSTFALMFILVGALVIFATVSKMIDEQRTLVGTTKAVGFFNREIFAKYLLFGVSGTVIGVVLGMIAARFVMEPLALGGYDRYYTHSLNRPVIAPVPTLAVLLAGVAVAWLAVWLACTRLLRTPAIRLMQAAVPQGTKKAAGGSRSGSLYTRLILLNMRSDWRRVLVTIVSVAGCCALVVIGFTLQSAVSGTLRHQYGEIVAYDECVKFDPETNGDAQQSIAGLLRSAGASYAPLYDADITYQLSGLETGELLCGDIDEIGTFYHLNDWKTGQPIAAADDGIFIQRRVAEMGRMDVGDTLEIAVGGTQTATVTVAGIYENYIGRAMVMDPVYYETVFGEKCTPNAFYVRYDDADDEALNKALRQVDGFESTVSADSDRAMFATATSVISSLVLLFIFMAAIMAGVVLMNLTNMYILQKKRELTIMRVNGFSTSEVISYVTRETILTTAAGILLGFALGSGVAYRIVRSMEQSFVQYDRSISFIAWALAAAITVVFTVLVNVVALRPVKHLKLTDVA